MHIKNQALWKNQSALTWLSSLTPLKKYSKVVWKMFCRANNDFQCFSYEIQIFSFSRRVMGNIVHFFGYK